MSKKDRESWGLPPLTLAEAARELGVAQKDFIEWLQQVFLAEEMLWDLEHPGKVMKNSGQIGRFINNKRPISKDLIRLYLVTHRARWRWSELSDAPRSRSQREGETGNLEPLPPAG